MNRRVLPSLSGSSQYEDGSHISISTLYDSTSSLTQFCHNYLHQNNIFDILFLFIIPKVFAASTESQVWLVLELVYVVSLEAVYAEFSLSFPLTGSSLCRLTLFDNLLRIVLGQSSSLNQDKRNNQKCTQVMITSYHRVITPGPDKIPLSNDQCFLLFICKAR